MLSQFWVLFLFVFVYCLVTVALRPAKADVCRRGFFSEWGDGFVACRSEFASLSTLLVHGFSTSCEAGFRLMAGEVLGPGIPS